MICNLDQSTVGTLHLYSRGEGVYSFNSDSPGIYHSSDTLGTRKVTCHDRIKDGTSTNLVLSDVGET